MSGQAYAPVPEDPPPVRARRGAPVAGALLAVAVSGGLVWWLAAPERSAPTPSTVVRPASAVVAKARLNADPAQVQRAFEAVQDAYANGGPEGLARADADCAAALKADPKVLDYCLAFDLFAAAVAPEIARRDAAAVRLAQAQAALPSGADAAARIADVQRLMRAESLGAAAPSPERPVRLATAAPARARLRQVRSLAEEQRREAARAEVRALFARAQAAREAADNAAPIDRPEPDRAAEAPH